MNQPYRTVFCALATVAWLSLSSYATNATATQLPTAQSDNLSISTTDLLQKSMDAYRLKSEAIQTKPACAGFRTVRVGGLRFCSRDFQSPGIFARGLTSSPPSITREADSKTSIFQNTGNSRSPAQKMQLSQQTIPIVTTADLPPGFNIPIAIPTYLPSGFYLKEFQAFDAGYVGQDAFHYSITYEEVDNSTCLEISSGIDGTSFESLGLSETSVKLSQGEVTVYSGNVEGKPIIVALDWGKQIGLPSSDYRMTLISGYDSSGGSCNPVSMEEFIQVLQSLKPLK